MPLYDDDDKTAILALIRKYQRLWYDRDRDRKIKAAAEERLAANETQHEKLKAAFDLFDVDGFKKKNWDQLADDIGREIFFRAIVDISYRPAPKLEFEDQYEPARLLASVAAGPEPETPESHADTGATVRDIALQRLKDAGSKGTKAGEIRQHIEALRGSQLHEKTVGMTLYRLSQDGLARRDGRTWFFVPEAENPSAEDAGAH